MAYTRPDTYLSDAQKRQIYEAIERVHVTASESIFYLHHLNDPLPIVKPYGPYDVPETEPSVTVIPLHAMVGMKKDERELNPGGEEIESDAKFFVWLEEMEGTGLGTTAGELDLLTKDKLVFQGEDYEILSCRPCMPFFGQTWERGSTPSPRWNRSVLTCKILANRMGTDRE